MRPHYPMPELLQSVYNTLRYPLIQGDLAGKRAPRIERRWEMRGVEVRRIKGRLQIHAEVHDIEKELQSPLVL